jgi:hypothetical protein
MGIKTTHAGLTYAPSHIAAANKVGQNVQSIHADIQLQCTELLRSLALLQNTMQGGDGNIAAIASLITALQ